MVTLRPYQKEAVTKVFEHWRDHPTALLVQATGTGKTIVFSEIAKKIANQGGRTLILAHRDELITQARDKILTAQGIVSGIEKAHLHAGDEPIIIGSVQTLGSKKRLQQFNPREFSHIIVDEAHHIVASQYQTILKYFSDAKLLGVTATPYRGDKKDLSSVFDSITYEYSLIQAIREGYLAPILFKQIPLEIDLSNVHQNMGDFLASDLGYALDPYLEKIADVMVEECRNRKTAVFLPLIATSVKFTELLNKRGFRAAEINGKTTNRAEILKEFEQGNIDVLCNSMLLTEGWDCPSLDCIVNLRPTRSESLYTQILGRGTRICENKENLFVLDFLWQSERYDLCKPSILVAGNKNQEEKINEIISDGEQVDLLDALEQAKRDIVAERENTLAKELAEKRHRKGKLIDPIQYGLSINAEDLIDYYPQFLWEKEPPTEKQIQYLKKNDVDISQIPNKGYASKLIGRLQTRGDLGLATPKQIRLLERYGFRNVGLWNKDHATKLISRIKENRWRVPYSINPRTYKPEGV